MNEHTQLRSAGKRKRIRVMIVDDSEAVRSGLMTFLEAFDDLRLVGQAANGTEAAHLCEKLKPDVLLMDLTMPGMDGVTATRSICQDNPDVPVIALTSFGDECRAGEALEAGAVRCLGKCVSIDLLAEAIRQAYAIRQGRLFPPSGPSAP